MSQEAILAKYGVQSGSSPKKLSQDEILAKYGVQGGGKDEPGFVGKALDKLDSYTGVPTRAAAKSLLDGKGLIQAGKDFADYYGTPPSLAPSAKDIQTQAGIPEIPASKLFKGDIGNHLAAELTKDKFPGFSEKIRNAPHIITPLTGLGEVMERTGADFDAAEFGTGAALDWTNAIPLVGQAKQLGKLGKGTKLAIPGAAAAEGFLRKGAQKAEGLIRKGGELYQKAVAPIADSIKDYSNVRALKTLGIKKGDAKRLIRNKQVNSIADTLFDEDLVKPFSTPSSMHESIKGLTDPLSEKIGESIGTLDKAVGKQVSTGKFLDWLENGLDIDKSAGEKAPAAVQKYINRLAAKGDWLGVEDLWDMRKQIDRTLKRAYKNKAFQDLEGSQDMLFAMRTALRDLVVTISDAAQSRGMVEGVPGSLKGDLDKAHKLFSASDIAEKEMAGEISNRAVGLTDTIAGVGGFLSGRRPLESATKTVIGVGGNKLARTYGSGISAVSARKAYNAVKDPRGLIKGAGKKALGATKGLLRVRRAQDE